MQRRRRINPKEDAKFYLNTGKDKLGLDIKYISAFKGRGIFTYISFEKGDFLLEYRGELISKQECERRQRLYHDRLKVFMFEFHFNGKLWCVDAAKEDGSLGRLVNDDHINPNAKMKYLTVQGKPHLCLFAIRDISPGEEITYNYGDSDWPWRSQNPGGKSSDGCHGEGSPTSEPSTSTQTASTSQMQKKTSASASTCWLRSFDKATTEVTPPKSSEATSSQPAVEDGEKMMTDSNRIHSALSDSSQTSPMLSSPNKCQEHRLVSATVSSLDKCNQCMGPTSSLKWLGFQCKVCSGVWHETCLRRIMNGDLQDTSQEQKFSKCSVDELLSDSGEEYIPNSESQDDDDDEDSDTSIPFMPSQSKASRIQVKPILIDAGSSHGSDTSIPVASSTTTGWPASEHHVISNAADASDSSNSNKALSKEKPKDKAELHEGAIYQTMSKKNYCYVCGKPQSKISRHLRTHSKTHAEIENVFSLPGMSQERKILLEKMRNKGNFRHNTTVLQGEVGPLKVKRTPKANSLAGRFIHCMHCQGMFIRKELWRHVRRCPCKPENEDLDGIPGRTKILSWAAAHESAFFQQTSAGVWKLVSAQSLYNKHGQDPTKYEYMRQKLREVGRLLLCLRTEFSVHNLEEAIKPVNFQRVVQAVKKVSGFNEEKHSYLN